MTIKLLKEATLPNTSGYQQVDSHDVKVKQSTVFKPVTNSCGWSLSINMIFENKGVRNKIEACITMNSRK